MKSRMQRLALAAAILVSFSGCGTTVQPVITDCYVWPNEGATAYNEIVALCGGAAMPNCPAHREWRSRMRNLKNQIDATACEPLGEFTEPVAPQ